MAQPLTEAIPIRELSRLRAFQAQHVALKYSWLSWSGVRQLDGVVVFAMAEDDVETDDGGSRCLLWSRDAGARFGTLGSNERLAHCRLAAWHGTAEGLLVRSDALVVSAETLGVRVERIVEQYWALWGSADLARRADGPVLRTRFASGAAA